MKSFTKIALVLFFFLGMGLVVFFLSFKEQGIMEKISHQYSEFLGEIEKYSPENIGTLLTRATDSLDTTTQKYFKVPFMEGVAFKASNGSLSGKSSPSSSSCLRCMAKYQTRVPIPASRITKPMTEILGWRRSEVSWIQFS